MSPQLNACLLAAMSKTSLGRQTLLRVDLVLAALEHDNSKVVVQSVTKSVRPECEAPSAAAPPPLPFLTLQHAVVCGVEQLVLRTIVQLFARNQWHSVLHNSVTSGIEAALHRVSEVAAPHPPLHMLPLTLLLWPG